MARLVPKIYPNDVDENTPIGLSFPLTIGTSQQNFVTTQQIHDNLRNLIMTMPGERVLQPDFGSDLYYLLFEPMNDEEINDAAQKAVKDSVANYMPWVTIQKVSVEDGVGAVGEHTKQILVEYSVEGWPVDNVLNLEVKI